jgi:LPS-assembly protein
MCVVWCAVVPASAQTPPAAHPGETHVEPITGNKPVTFLADNVSYDRVNGIVSATGHVQAWQGDHYLAADRVTFDRNTGVAAAYGHVVIVEPDGQIVFGDYAELSEGMRNGIIKDMRALLADGGKLAANGARRIEGKLNEMSRGVYSSCNLCALDPKRAPEWQIRANHMTEDLEHKRIEYSNAWIDAFGFPVFWVPWMSSTDPSVKRQTGLLPPSFGYDTDYLGTFLALPYFIVLDDQSDLTLTPEVSSRQGGQFEADYRRDFNAGVVNLQGGVGSDEGQVGGFIFSSANFTWDDTWHYGASVNLGTSEEYLRDYQIEGFLAPFLASSVYVEGYGVGSYTRLDSLVWQGLNSSINSSSLPYVLPQYTYSFFSEPDLLGGRVSFDTQAFNVLRPQGTSDQRIAGRLAWDRHFAGLLGEQYTFTATVQGTAYQATELDAQPSYGTAANSTTVHGLPQVSLKINWPFVRDAGSLGTQLLEPIIQVIAAPQSGNSLHDLLPNEDSLAYEFTDATLFSLNRFGGYDRSDGGVRANFALHGNWTFVGGQELDALIGASVIEHIDQNLYPQFQPWNGFDRNKHLSDIVGRASFVPNKWLDFTVRARVDHSTGDLNFADAVTSFGDPHLRLNFGYLYGSINPYTEYLANFNVPGYLMLQYPYLTGFFTPRNDVSAGFSTKWGRYSLSATARRNLETGQMDSVDGHAKWEDECTIFDILFQRRYTSIFGDHGDTTIMFTLTLKTVGQIGFK